jgi:NDP-sugar pyrophosphorylase family protein
VSPKKSNTKTKINLKRYLREYQALGTAGGLYHFRDEILRGNPQQFFVMHVDIACSFPLEEMLKAHMWFVYHVEYQGSTKRIPRFFVFFFNLTYFS